MVRRAIERETDLRTLAEELAMKHNLRRWNFKGEIFPHEDGVAAVNEALERAAQEAEKCAAIYADSGGKSQKLIKGGVCLGIAARIRSLKSDSV
jgi:hypothetical protein